MGTHVLVRSRGGQHARLHPVTLSQLIFNDGSLSSFRNQYNAMYCFVSIGPYIENRLTSGEVIKRISPRITSVYCLGNARATAAIVPLGVKPMTLLNSDYRPGEILPCPKTCKAVYQTPSCPSKCRNPPYTSPTHSSPKIRKPT